jgi:hypothetical protein
VKDIGAMKKTAERIHQEVLQLISALSDDNSSDGGSFVSNSSIFIALSTDEFS